MLISIIAKLIGKVLPDYAMLLMMMMKMTVEYQELLLNGAVFEFFAILFNNIKSGADFQRI